MARITTAERAALPERAFVFPKKRSYPLYRMEGDKVVPDKKRAQSAIRFATLLEDKGDLSKGKAGKVRGAARKVLKKIEAESPAKTSKPRKSKKNPCTDSKREPNKPKLQRTATPKFKFPKGRSWHPPRQWTVLPELGRVVDLVVRHPDVMYRENYGSKVRPLMLWDRQSKTLLWVSSPRKVPPLKSGAAREGGHADIYENWMDDGSEATHHREGYQVPSKTDIFHRSGSAVAIGYNSDKFDGSKGTTYQHDFTSDVSVYTGQFGTSHAVALRGGNLRVTARGIEG